MASFVTRAFLMALVATSAIAATAEERRHVRLRSRDAKDERPFDDAVRVGPTLYLAGRIGLVPDLHGRFDPLLPKVLRGVDGIVLAGDTVDETLLDRLREIAPLHAVRGSNDRSPGLLSLPEFLELDLAGTRILVAHDRKD